MSDLAELYQELVLDHNSRPRNFRKLVRANRSAEGFNPLCGDRVVVYLDVEDDIIADIGFQGTGCAISRAATSMLTEAVKGKSIMEVQRLFDMFHQQVMGDDLPAGGREDLGDLEAFAGIREYPSRVKCAVLGWHTLKAALEDASRRVSTE